MYLRTPPTDPFLTNRSYRPKTREAVRMIEEFRNSGRAVMEVIFTRYEYISAASCRSTFANTLNAMKLYHIRVMTKNGRVFLVNDLLLQGRER